MTERHAHTVRQLAECHRPLLTDLLRQDEANNELLIHRLATYGVRSKRTSWWGAFEGPRLAGVALLLDASASFYASDSECLAGLVPFVSRAENLSGQLSVMEAVLALMPANRLIWRQVDWLCWLPKESFRPAPQMGARPATLGDLGGLSALYARSEAFRRRTAAEVASHVERQLESCRFFVVEAGDRIVSAAAVTAETAESAMIVSVFTAPEYRTKGLGSAVVSASCASLLGRGLRPRLLYREENEAAGRCYARLGFQRVSRWLLARLTPAD